MVPAFEKSCKAMFEQVDATFHKGMVEHSAAAQQHFESAHSPLALALRVCTLVLCPAFSLLILYMLINIPSLMLSIIIMLGVFEFIQEKGTVDW